MKPAAVRVCIIGCGAQTEQAYLPTLSRMSGCELVALIDKDLAKCRTLAERYRIAHHGSRIDELPDALDAAFVVLPHHLHGSASCELMQRKLHVFCEKPMATTRAEAEAMIRWAREHAVQLGIGNHYRSYWTSRRIKQLLESKELGDLVSFRIEDGKAFNWPTASGFYFDKEKAGGGVLIDTGAHVLDLVLWWLQEYPTTVTYEDDNWGGVEAECRMQLGFRSAEGSIRLSRLKEANRYRLTFEQGTVEFRPYDPSGICNVITLERDGRAQQLRAEQPRRYPAYFREQLLTFVDAVQRGAAPPVSGESVLPSIKLIEECYRGATRLKAPWLGPGPASTLRTGEALDRTDQRDAALLRNRTSPAPAMELDLAKSTILVTGASGFIGGRIVERLSLEYGTRPRCLLKNFNKAARIARFPIDAALGDVLDYDSVLRATEGCDLVIHCAYGNTPDDDLNDRINAEGTRNLVRASLRHGVRRFVQLSSIEVYGQNQPRVVTEETPTQPSAYNYGNSKLEAERICIEPYPEGRLPAVILRIAAVYGPYAPWSIDVVNRLIYRGFCQSDSFAGLCNPIYIDDCVDAVFLAATRSDASGQTFIISGGETVTWNEYFERHNQMLGLPPLPTASMLQLRLYRLARQCWDLVFDPLMPRYGGDMVFRYKTLRERGRMPNLRALLQRGSLLKALDVFSRRAYYSIEKAKRELGFVPKYDFERGMAMVKAWYYDS